MAANGPLPDAPALLYVGKVMHHRMRPKVHRFSYNVFSLMIDIDRLDEAGAISRLFKVNRRAPVSFFESDHLEKGFTDLRAQIDHQLKEAGVKERASRIILVSYPRIAGFVFNPLSVYYAEGQNGQLLALIYEVSNTFGSRHTYVCPLGEGQSGASCISQSAEKQFHVSPFLEMEMRYHFRMLPPGRSIRWRILAADAEGPKLAATFSGEARPLSSASLGKLLVQLPFQTFKIYAGIHYEALKLWFKGVPFFGMTPHYSQPQELGETLIADSEKIFNLHDKAA
jgi:hypothetical protein